MPEQSRERPAATGGEARASQTRATRAATGGSTTRAPDLGEASRSSGASSSGVTTTDSATTGTAGHAGRSARLRDLGIRPQRYLAAPGDGDARRLRAELDRHPGIRLLRWIEPAAAAVPLAVFAGTPADAAALFERTGALIEPDQRLRHGAPCGFAMSDPTGPDSIGAMQSAPLDVIVEVEDDAGRPVADAAVFLINHDCSITAVTGAGGHAALRVPAEVCETASALVIRPARGHWSVQIPRPALTPESPFKVVCARLEPSGHEPLPSAWSRHAVGLGPDHGGAAGPFGAGARVALIGSGADLDHPDLADANIAGYDLIERDEKAWRTDTAGAGTCSASLLVGRGLPGEQGLAVPGVCRDAELHVLKLAPGGRTSELIEALDYCADHGIDVACVCVGLPSASPLLAAKIRQARDAGVCVIAAAGDQPDAVLYPAALPGVLAVGALGCLGTFPPESNHAVRMATTAGPEGYFVAGCTPSDPAVDLYAPGVAVLGAAPGGGYVPCDGTAMAVAYAGGVAGLIAAHHPAARDRTVRGAARADLIAHLLLASAYTVQTGSLVRVPNAASALGGGGGGPVSVSEAGMHGMHGMHV